MPTTSQGGSYRSLEEKYGLYDFHRPEAREAALGLMLAPAPRPVLLLSGEPGIGRGYFLEAVAYRAGQEGRRPLVLPFDLEGFEDGPAGLSRFLAHWQARRSEEAAARSGERLALLEKLAGRIPSSVPGAAILSLLLQWKGPVQDLLHVLGDLSDDLPGPERPPRESLRLLLEEFCRSQRLILHVRKSAQLDDVLRRVLLDEARHQGNLVLALSCHSRDADEAVAPRSEVLRLDFERLTAADVRAALDGNFQPHALPDDLMEALARDGGGRPGPIALRMQDLVTHEAVLEDPAGTWRLGEGGLEAVAREFPLLLDPLRSYLWTLDIKVSDRLNRFLDLAALCGENVPADLLFAHLELDKERRDELLDRIDEDLVEDEALRLFRDHQYDHPSFTGLLTYSFLNPVYATALLDELAPHKRAPLAAELLGFLRQQIEVGTRGMAYLFLHLADELESDEERQRILLELGWWVSDDEAAVLAAKVAEDLDSDRLSSEAALSLVAEARDRWPPSRRLAVLEGIRQSRSGVPPPLAGSLDFLQAEALGVLSRPAEALPFAREAARLWESQAGPQSAPVGAATFLLGSLEYDLGQDLEAQTHLSSALSLLEAMPGQEQVIGALLVRLSHAYARQGRLEEADRDARRAVSWARQFFGDHDPRTAAALSAQAEIFLHRQEPGAALPLLEEALVIEREAYGERHPWNANLLGNLGVIHLQLGDLEQARQLLEESLALKLEIFGAESPDTQTTRQALEEVLSRLGGG
jgi:tetratricopeptide (TPR) repeat protein